MNGLAQYILLPLLIFIVSLVFMRLIGKKAVSDMSNLDFLLLIVLGGAISGSLFTTRPLSVLMYSFIFVLAYLLYNYALQHRTSKSLLVQPTTVLIRNGDVDEKGLREVRMTTEDLIRTLRQKGYTSKDDVELALMEENGVVSVIPKSHVRPLKPEDIQLHPSPAGIPVPLIMDGEILEHNLRFLEKDERWLNEKLQAFGFNLTHAKEVTLAVYHQNGTFSLDVENETRNIGSRHPVFRGTPT